jgi:CysZ protein
MRLITDNNPMASFGYLVKGLKWLTKAELRQFILIPFAINLVLYSTLLFLAYTYIDALIQQFIPDWLTWLNWIVWPLFFAGFFVIGFFTFTLIANLLAAPFYGALSAKTTRLIKADPVFVKEPPVVKVVLAELGRARYLLLRAIPLLILSFIPGINIVAPVLWGLFGAWAMTMEYFAYPLENAGILFAEQKQILSRYRLSTLSFGGLVMLGLTLPLLNILIAPAAVIGASLWAHDRDLSRREN